MSPEHPHAKLARAAWEAVSVSDVAARFERWAAAGFTDISMRQMSIDQSAAVHSLGLLGEVRAQVS